MLDLPDSTLRAVVVIGLAGMFVFAGVMHFVKPQMFEAIVPPYLPSPRALVFISGVAEILGGIGLLIPATRVWAGVGLVALLLAVFPANLYMAQEAEQFRQLAPAWALWARLPLQGVLVAAVVWASGLWP
ncbi:MAG: DoxX family protein [Rubricoccaceae bacterium]